MKRRKFIRNTSVAGMGLLVPGMSYSLGEDLVHIKILHTNDMHSRIEPFPEDGGRNAGLGGMARRAAVIAEKRKSYKNLLLLDSGDIFQGTPYFNQFGGELEFKLMSEMGYDVATIGNHDFDGGMDNLVHQMKHAQFEMVSCNYDFSDTEFAPFNQDYVIRELSDVRIGILGCGVELDGLVPASLYGRTRYLNPIVQVEKVSKYLKKVKNCDYVICLSHLGYRYRGSRVSDIVLAESTKHVDLILGGHTHTFMEEPDIRQNLEGRDVVIHQSGWGGILLGEIDIYFAKERSWSRTTASNGVIS